MDIDLAGRTENRPDHIKAIVSAVCVAVVEPDGIEFDRDSIEVRRIKEDADYEGVRVQFQATLAKARIPMQLDIGFGDVITPGPTEVSYPTILDFPPPVIRAYPKETVVTEKLEALTGTRFGNAERPLNSNPLASRKRIAMTPRVSFSGGHSYGGAGSEKRNVT